MATSAWQYTADNGTIFQRQEATDITAQQVGGVAVVGGVAAAGTEPTLPKGYIPRKVEVHNGAIKREVVANVPNALVYQTANPIVLQHGRPSANLSCVSTGHWRGEIPPRRFHT